jgi:acetyl-CoA decarbonylase/synthase complex subunit delta
LSDENGDIMAEERRKAVKVGDLNRFLSDGNIRSLEGLSIEGDIEIEVDVGGADGGPILAAGYGQEIVKMATQLLNFSKALGYPADNLLVPPKR